MKPLFIFSPPRHRGDLLVRILNGTRGIRAAGEAHDFLARLRRLHAFRAASLRDNPGDFPAEGGTRAFQRHLNHSTEAGWDAAVRSMLPAVCEPPEGTTCFAMRDIHSLTGDWEKDAEFLSWLHFLEPDASFVFLKRDEVETEISTEITHRMWIPKYGKCVGSVMRRIRAVWEVMDRYHRLNPESTSIVDSALLLDFDGLSEVMRKHGVEIDQAGWERAKDFVTSDKRREIIREGIAKVGGATHNDRPPLPPMVERKENLVVHTLRFGEEPWIEECRVSLETWCARHGLPLRVWGEWNPDYPSAKFVVLDMLKDFLRSKNDWFCYIDADVYFHPLAPVPPLPPSGVLAMPDGEDVAEKWEFWLGENFRLHAGQHIYRNAGVWFCDRDAAERILAAAMTREFVEGMMEQHQWNLWLMGAGVEMHELSPEFNMFCREPRAAWFFHLAGRGDKMRKLGRVRNAGLLPAPASAIEIMPAPAHERAILFPWTPHHAKWQELRYSLRSIEKYFADKDCPIFILAERPPSWLKDQSRVRFIRAVRYEDALQIGLQLAEKVLWMNDDIYLRKPCDWSDFEVGSHYGRNVVEWAKSTAECQTKWRNRLKQLVRDLHHHGIEEVFNFSTHTPYVFEYQRAMPVLRTFGVYHKIAFETAYWNFHPDLPRRKIPAELRGIAENHQHAISEEARRRIAGDLPEAAPWEFDTVVIS